MDVSPIKKKLEWVPRRQPSSILNAADLLRREDHENTGTFCYLPVSPGAWLRGCDGEDSELGLPLRAAFLVLVRDLSLRQHSGRIIEPS